MRTYLFHVIAVLLVVAYVNLFTIWRDIGRLFGTAIRDGLPFILGAAVFAGVLMFVLWRRKSSRPPSIVALGAALGLAVIGFASTDPAFPAKRIHVIEYALLSGVLWFSLPSAARTRWTPFYVFFVVVLYGIHDEWLQGLHPNRTYGLRDMFVNLCGAGAGVLAMYGLFAASKPAGSKPQSEPVDLRVVSTLALLVLGVCLFAFAGTGFRRDLVPFWTVLPVLAGALAVAFAAEATPAVGDRFALRAIVGVSLLFSAYPVVINVALLDFA